MKLPFGKKDIQSTYYLALVLRQEQVNAVIFEEEGLQIRVVGKHKVPFSKNIEDATLDELLDTIDKALATAEAGLPENVETRKTVFGVKETWVKDAKIKPEYLAKLKKVSDELGLEPIGFLTLGEAIAHLLQKEEGAPITAILAEICNHFLTVTLIRAGKVIESKSAALEGKVPQAVDTLLKHFTSVDVLPSRVIVFDGEKDFTQEFITHQWSKSLPFLHMPQIVSLPQEFDAKAVLYGAATQMGFTFSPDTHMPPNTPKPEIPVEKRETVQQSEEQLLENAPEPTHAFGFQEGVDVGGKEPVREDVSQSAKAALEQIAEIPDEVELNEERKQLGTQGIFIKTGAVMAGKAVLSSLQKVTVMTHVTKLLPKKGLAALIVPLLILLVVGLGLFYFFGVSANVLLSVQPKTKEQTEALTFATDAATSSTDHILASEFITVSEDGTQSTPATGKKTIGNKAKGKVTIFNNNDSSKTISSGISLTSANGLTFITDTDVTVASASGDVFSGTKPGTADVPVTASTFGTEYNLPSDTKFSLSGSSTVAAKNDSAFSGGTKQDVTVVSKDDESKLLDALQKSLAEKAKQDFSGKLGSDKQTLENFTTSSVDKKTFDKNVGDQAKQVSLTATLSYQGIVYKKHDLLSFAKSILSNGLPKEITISDSDIYISAKDAKAKNDKEVQASVAMSAKLLPALDTTSIAKKIAGKSYADAEHILSGLTQVSGIQITASPNIPLLPKILPHLSSHIHITTQNE